MRSESGVTGCSLKERIRRVEGSIKAQDVERFERAMGEAPFRFHDAIDLFRIGNMLAENLQRFAVERMNDPVDDEAR